MKNDEWRVMNEMVVVGLSWFRHRQVSSLILRLIWEDGFLKESLLEGLKGQNNQGMDAVHPG